jgi:nicotinamide-nucleotide adenylyltransferase
MKPKVGLILGRFQPFHKGHLYLIKKALKQADKVVIAVGSSNKYDHDNPLTYRTRLKILKKVIAEEGLEEKIITIIPLADNPNDDLWLKQLLKKTGGFNIVFGNNAWPNGILKKAGFQILEVPYLNRPIYQGVYIRKLVKEEGSWQRRVPPYLITIIQRQLMKKMPKN